LTAGSKKGVPTIQKACKINLYPHLNTQGPVALVGLSGYDDSRAYSYLDTLIEAIKITNLIVFKPISRYYNQDRRGKRDVIEPQLLHELISLGANILVYHTVYSS